MNIANTPLINDLIKKSPKTSILCASTECKYVYALHDSQM